jgi:hypothetical protein
VVTGDLYYVSVCDKRLLSRVVLADVAGHGEAVARMPIRDNSHIQWFIVLPTLQLTLATLLAAAGSDRTVEPVQPVVGDWGLANILPPPRSTPLVRRL